jgi:hypothetical protein
MKSRLALAGLALLLAACDDVSEICSDGADNDEDGLIDCADSDCPGGTLCSPNGETCSPDQTCSVCSGNGGPAEPNGETLCGDGADNDCDGLVDCADPDCGCGANPGQTPSGTVGYIRFVGAESNVLGAAGSGYNEQTVLTFAVTTVDGRPFPGLHVQFSHESQGGSFIGSVNTCTSGTPQVCTAAGTTDSEGNVRVLLTSGRRFALLMVRAEASAGDRTAQIVAGGFAVIGAKPNGAHFSLDCDPYNVPALTVHDCLYSRYDGEYCDIQCSATIADRHGIQIGLPTLVAFQSEAGNVPPAAFTPAYVPGQPAPAGLGRAVGTLQAYGATLPFDVDPFPNELSASFDDGCGPKTANPRDGLVTVVALVRGEEGFVDRNLNGAYDAGEPYIDLGEPYLDWNDDGMRNPGEWFSDLNGNGTYDGPNGRWDSDTVLWTQARVLYTGYPWFAWNASSQLLFSRFYTSGTPPAPTPAPLPFLVHKGPPATTAFYGVFFTDGNLNPLSSVTTFEISALVGNVTATLTEPTHTADSLGTTFRQLYCEPAASGTCRDGPVDQACVTSPCHLVTDVGDAFVYGNYATAAITCAEEGRDTVIVEATVEGVTNGIAISGECVP